jgi:hypothetical protein
MTARVQKLATEIWRTKPMARRKKDTKHANHPLAKSIKWKKPRLPTVKQPESMPGQLDLFDASAGATGAAKETKKTAGVEPRR